jgi:hypothetical protein
MQEGEGQLIELNDVDHAGTVFMIHGHRITYECLCTVVERFAQGIQLHGRVVFDGFERNET